MAKYTIEDIEILRQKSGISYEEAVNLLEYHNGSLARALVDLEKNGRLKSGATREENHKGLKGVLQLLYRQRLVVKKEEITIVNLSVLFMLLSLCVAPHICVVGLIASLVLGYRISVVRNSQAFAKENLDDLIKNAKNNVQSTVNSFAQQFTREEAPKEAKPEPQQPRAESAPSGTRPVNVQFSDGGSVNVRDEGDGFHEADIH